MGYDVINDVLDIDNTTTTTTTTITINKERIIFESLYLPVNIHRNTTTGTFDIITDEIYKPMTDIFPDNEVNGDYYN